MLRRTRLNTRTGAVALGTLVLSCAQTPEPITPRTFERAGKLSVVCLKVYKSDQGIPVQVAPEPQVASECVPTPRGMIDSSGRIVSDAALENHLYALVTQTSRGEIAVVDLSAGVIIDPDPFSPGVNFLPVGSLPTDITTAPDGRLTFVTSADPNRPALFAIDNKLILGRSQARLVDQPIPKLANWPVCALPSRPGAVHIVPTSKDSGEYSLAVVLSGDGHQPAALAIIDPIPLLRGADSAGGSAGTTQAADGGASVAPGSMAACPIVAITELGRTVPAAWAPGATWGVGVSYIDSLPPASPSTATCADDALPRPLAADTSAVPLAAGSAVDGTTLYVADGNLPIIHVFDLSSPGAPSELAPLIASSVLDPSRAVRVGAIAVSPSTHDYRRYLYAVDERAGSLMVFDVSSPQSPRTPLLRPHPEVQPFQPPDRIQLGVPITAISFARTDFPLALDSASRTGLLCNPNPNVGVGPGPFLDPGANYRDNVANGLGQKLGPSRLRGIFAFVTLSDGNIVTIDVDDWDAPCRRPDPLSAAPNGIVPAEPSAISPTDFDPYHSPIALQRVAGGLSTPVSLESFFPVSTPHRARSGYRLRRDEDGGPRVPQLASVPQLFFSDSPIALGGTDGLKQPILLPTRTDLPDPTFQGTPEAIDSTTRGAPANPETLTTPPIVPGDPLAPAVRFAFEDPTVHVDQDWTVTYEGALPGFENLAAAMKSEDGYKSLLLQQEEAQFCARGVEDAHVGTTRAQAALADLDRLNLPKPARVDVRTSDYVQVIDEILPPGDPYWSDASSDCWPETLATPAKRHDACVDTFGSSGDQRLQRDFPILEAHDDRLTVGTYYYPQGSSKEAREIVSHDPTNVDRLKGLRCCFHRQARFRVRTGSQWIAVGSSYGYLHHIVKDPTTGACIQSCSPRDVLLNARAMALPRPHPSAGNPPSNSFLAPLRDSPAVLRNPAFAFAIWNGFNSATGADISPTRDLVWKFSTRGQFVPLSVRLGAGGLPVSPQSSKYIDILGQLAVVDAASQGLVLLDLSGGLISAHAPYY